ncbi:MAG TPA: bifunctional UDP-N-acetylglucosamine diphosphorylase/glucosamine-1-phosphate N-acetyltransferase GlmU, partial [Candidatus Acidoferrales bacterium]|nr:bifunctional UDP-N-acetylglucosamine diphosphorylase/glucosamine-1-phosphate N-acetyltransferase GlmU [Candidatus Acidoferrales bacterium]
MRQTHTFVLAAGKGTRMKSRRPKVLHELCGATLLARVLETVRAASAGDIRVIASPELQEHVEALGARAVIQEPQRGTGHAVQIALADLPHDDLPILIVSADMPLVPVELLERVATSQGKDGVAVAFVTAKVPLPSNFGRVIREKDAIVAIVEARDATKEQLQVDEVNAGIYCFDQVQLRRVIGGLKTDNAQAELYLTDCLAALVNSGRAIEAVRAAHLVDTMGINNREELAAARAVLQHRILQRHMLEGVTIVDPTSTYVDATVTIGADSTIYPQTHLLGRTNVGSGCIIGPGSQISNSDIGDRAEIVQSVVRDSTVGEDATVGPFAHLRGKSVIEPGAHIGNFVETKNTRMGRGAKASHLSYVGDADVGERANIGAGTITCNYDGKKKNKTKIGKQAFIGSNSSLVAPVEVGDGALTGAGSVVLKDVPAGERVAGNPAKPLRKKESL